MSDPTKFPDDPAAAHADERLMTPPDQSRAARSDSLWRTPVEDALDLHDADHDHLEEALDALEFDDAPGDMPPYADWSDDRTGDAGRGDAARAIVAAARDDPVATGTPARAVAPPRPRTKDTHLGDVADRPRRKAEDVVARERDRIAGAAHGAWD